MVVYYCEICDRMIDGEWFHFQLWNAEHGTKYGVVCADCAKRFDDLIDDLKEGAEE